MKKFQYDENALEEEFVKSRSQKKRESTALQEEAEKLVKFSASVLKEKGLDDEIIEAIEVYKKTSSKEAKRRQMQYIGKLMRVK